MGECWFVTGGTGTLGKSLVKRLLKDETHPKDIIVYSRDEYKQYVFREELHEMGLDLKRIRFFIGDVRDLEHLKLAMRMKPDVVVHAAALKQIPSCEYNPMETIQTNIIGTMNVTQSAVYSKVKKVLFISSDKAVNPANLYGATKMCAERLVINSNVLGQSPRAGTATLLSCVRYGNVLSSRGSVVQMFEKQIKAGVAATITDPDMTRFWWTIEEAVSFILLTVSCMSGGEIFIPKLMSAEVVELLDVIADILGYGNDVSFFNPVGIRPGEKVHELLVSTEEMRRCYEEDDYFVIDPEFAIFPFTSHGKFALDHNRFRSDGPLMTYDELLEKVKPVMKGEQK